MKLFSFYADGTLTVQTAEYIEDGWYITHDSGATSWNLYEIPLHGGTANLVGSYPNIGEAIGNALELT